MFWNWIRKISLKSRLLALLVPALMLYTVASLMFTRDDAIRSINAAYDRSLLGAIRSIDLNVSVSSGGLAIELPYRLFEFFQLTASGHVYFRVATTDGLVEVGNTDLPLPPVPLEVGKPVFYDANYFGETVRVGAFMHVPDSQSSTEHVSQWIIQVAEGTHSREAFAWLMVRRALWRDGLMLLLVWGVLALGVTLALRPLVRLVRQTREREPADLRPLPMVHLPSELQTLVEVVNQQLQRTDSLMAERRNFIDDASHQLRTPLSALRVQLDVALRENKAQYPKAILQALSEELIHAIRGTNQLLALAQSDATLVRKERFDLARMVRQVALELLPLARKKGIDFGVELGDEQLMGYGDQDLIYQALMNVVHNAIEHGNAQGPSVVTINAFMQDASQCISVVDNGPGIPRAIAARLGQRFVKGKASRGSGLGMAIAHSVMSSHGGRLVVCAGEAGRGTEVLLTWPIS